MGIDVYIGSQLSIAILLLLLNINTFAPPFPHPSLQTCYRIYSPLTPTSSRLFIDDLSDHNNNYNDSNDQQNDKQTPPLLASHRSRKFRGSTHLFQPFCRGCLDVLCLPIDIVDGEFLQFNHDAEFSEHL